MEKLTIPAQKQPVENAVIENVYFGNSLKVIRITANDGFELVKDGDEASDIRTVDIPAMYEERVALYKAIPWVEKTETPEIEEDIEEPETEEQATEEDYINALKELGVTFDE